MGLKLMGTGADLEGNVGGANQGVWGTEVPSGSRGEAPARVWETESPRS